jgi:hypothetical protein
LHPAEPLRIFFWKAAVISVSFTKLPAVHPLSFHRVPSKGEVLAIAAFPAKAQLRAIVKKIPVFLAFKIAILLVKATILLWRGAVAQRPGMKGRKRLFPIP